MAINTFLSWSNINNHLTEYLRQFDIFFFDIKMTEMKT
jgi:hypothetical protein